MADRDLAGEPDGRVLVAAMGGLSEPSIPELPGIDSFEGAAFHTAHWDHDRDLDGTQGRDRRHRRLGDPDRAPPAAQVGRLTVFQRTPAWIFPHPGRGVRRRERLLFRRLPAVQRAIRDRGPLGPRDLPAAVQAAGLPLDPEGDRLTAPRRPGRRPGAARAADAGLRGRLQAHPALQRVLPRPAAAQRRAGHRGRRRGPPAGRGHRRRPRARGRHDRLGDRLQRQRDADRRAPARARWPARSATSGARAG